MIQHILNVKAGNWFICLFLLGGSASYAQAQNPHHKDNGTVMLENFQEDTTNHLPFGWYDRDGNKPIYKYDAAGRAKFHYKIMEVNGNKFLRFDGMEAQHINLPLINKNKENIYHINVSKTPILTWKWRALELPNGGNEGDDDTNDTVASLYVVWGFGHVLFKKVPKTVRYTWSTTLPKGKHLSKLFGNQQILVLKSGKTDKGKWITMQRNIVKDYKRLFGDKPPNAPLAILLLSDGDSTHSNVKADYDDILLKPAQTIHLNGQSSN